MMTNRWTQMAIAFAICSALGLGAWAQGRQKDRAPRLETITCPISLTSLKPGEVVVTSFPIRNKGRGVLTFQLRASCGCTQLEPREGSLEAGESVAIKVGVRLDVEGEQRTISLVGTTNDPYMPSFQVAIQAKLPATYRVEPDRLEFGRIGKGESKEIRFRVIDLEAARTGQAREIKILASPEMIRVEPVDAAGAFLAHTVPSENASAIHGSIELSLDGTKRITIPTLGEVVEPLLAIPRNFSIAAGSPAIKRSLIVRAADRHALGKLARISAPEGVDVVETNPGEPTMRRFDLTIRGSDTTRPDRGAATLARLEIHFEGERSPAVCGFIQTP